MFIHSFRRLFADEKGAEQQDDDADANRRVGDIKDIKGPERRQNAGRRSRRHSRSASDRRYCRALRPVPSPAPAGRRAASSSRIHQATPTAIAAVTATRIQRCVSFCAWARPRLIPRFSTQVRSKNGSSSMCCTACRLQRADDDPFGELVGDEDQQRDAVGADAAYPCTTSSQRAHKVAVFLDFGQQPPAAAAFVVVGLGHRRAHRRASTDETMNSSASSVGVGDRSAP